MVLACFEWCGDFSVVNLPTLPFCNKLLLEASSIVLSCLLTCAVLIL